MLTKLETNFVSKHQTNRIYKELFLKPISLNYLQVIVAIRPGAEVAPPDGETPHGVPRSVRPKVRPVF